MCARAQHRACMCVCVAVCHARTKFFQLTNGSIFDFRSELFAFRSMYLAVDNDSTDLIDSDRLFLFVALSLRTASDEAAGRMRNV